MRGVGLTELQVRNLEYLFTPLGLPLVPKTDGAAATTSILVRGGAGTGKTTLAVAIGQAIARRESGVVLYLTTEFSQTELLYKADMLGLADGTVVKWKDRAAAQSGAIVTEHLALNHAGRGRLTSEGRKTGAIETIWELLHPESGSETFFDNLHSRTGSSGMKVRAVVIDAFTLPDGTAEEKTLRSDLVAFIQALEGEGISTLIVEEATDQRASWLPFVVDLVFEIEWVADPDSADLHRKLRCLKSRYAQALPGPHDYGLDMGVPAVWPDLLSVASAPIGRELDIPQPAAMLVTLANHRGYYVSLTHGGVVLATKERPVSRLLKVVSSTPGVVVAEVRCGPLSVISGVTLPVARQVPDSEGAHSLGWALLEIVRAHGVNTVVFHDPEALLRRRRFEVPFLHVMEALRRFGILVIVYADKTHTGTLSSVADVADIRAESFYADHAREPRVFAHSRLRRAGIGLVNVVGLGGPILLSESQGELDTVQAQLRQALEQLEAVDLAGAKRTLLGMRTNVGGFVAWRTIIASGCVLYQLGQARAATERVAKGFPRSQSGADEASVWALALMGDDAGAVGQAVTALAHGPASPEMAILWFGLCAVHAQSQAAIESLRSLAGTPYECLFICLLLRALALRGHSDDVMKTAQRFAQQHQLPAWLVTRLKEEAMLESPRESERKEAFNRLMALDDNRDVPQLHRADVAHNLGVYHEEAGHPGEAIDRYQRALFLNPFLESARDGLVRLGAPVQPEPE